MVDVGTVVEVGDGIARIHGLAQAKYNELLQFPHDIMGIALNLEEDNVAAIILGDYSQLLKREMRSRSYRPYRRSTGGRRPDRPRGRPAGPAAGR